MLTNQIFQLNEKNVPERAVFQLTQDLRMGFERAVRSNQPILALEHLNQILKNLQDQLAEIEAESAKAVAPKASKKAEPVASE